MSSFEVIISYLPLIAKGAITTMSITLCSALIGIVGGFILGTIRSNKLKVPFLDVLFKAYVMIMQGTPIYVQLLIVYYALPALLGINLSAFTAGVITLGFHSIAYSSEIVRGAINGIPNGQWQACYVLGYTTNQALTIIIPQMLRTALPPLMNELSALIKETSLISVIGLMELTKVGINISAQTLDPLMTYGVIGLIYFIIISTLSLITQKIEKMVSL